MDQGVLNLTLHGVGEPPRALAAGESAVWLDRAAFERALDAAAGRPAVRLSFDDGNRSDLELALPALLSRGLAAAFFVCAGRLGDPGFLAADELADLAAAGMEVGSHGFEHRPWRGLDDGALERELVESRRTLEAAVGEPVRSAACPFGAYDRRVLRALRGAGYERVLTSDGGWADAGAWLQPRNTLGSGDDPAAAIEALSRPPLPHARAIRAARLAVKRWR